MNSNTGYIMTVANSIIGVGILAMPFCFMKCGILLSILLLVVSNLVTRIACHYLLKTSIKARRKNFEFLASHIFGSSGKLMVELCVIGYLMGTCITYFVVVGDLGPQIIAKLFSLNQTYSLRTFVMIIVTIFCIIPLALLKNIESLSFACTSSILFYFILVLKIFFEAESKIISSNWYENVYWWRPSGVTQCLPIFSMAFSCQMQIFEVYEAIPNRTLEKMNEIIKFGTAICTGVYILVGFFGYVAFNDQIISGNVLISLSPSLASDIIKMGFVISVAVSFPLVIFPCRASLYSLLYHRSHLDTVHYIPEHRFKYITISLVLVGLIIGILMPSIELVIGLVGSTIGVAICIMFPASCFIKTNKKNSTEKLLAQFLLVFGFLVMILGTYANLGAIDEQQSRLDIQLERKPEILSSFVPNVPDAENRISIQNMDQPPTTKIKLSNRKPYIKSSKSEKDTQKDGPIRDIQLHNNDQLKKVKSTEPVLSETEKPLPEIFKDKTADNKQSKKIEEPEKLNAKPQSAQILTESAIDNEAIQKEDQEIAIDVNEKKIENFERTKEMLKEVKDELSKKNQAVQEMVLEKIDKISQQVDSIEQMQKDELKKDADKKKIENNKKIDDKQDNRDKNEKLVAKKENESKIKPIEPADPVLTFLDKSIKMNLSKTNESIKDNHPPEDVKPIQNQVLQETKKEPNMKEGSNIGRDLLSENIVDNNNKPSPSDVEPNQSSGIHR